MSAGAGTDPGSVPPAVSGRCAVCGADRLEPRLRVAGEAGSEGLVPTTDRYGTALADVHRCADCGHMQVEPMPEGATLAAAYRDAESSDYLAEERGQRATAAALLAAIERRHKPGRLLEVGCWVGFLLDEARRRGWDPTGIEPSGFAAAYARERLGLSILEGDLEAAEPTRRSFDVVVMADVIEHLADPGAALDRARNLLAADGIVALTLPDAGSRLARLLGRHWWSVIPTHLHYFDRDGIARLLSAHGFEAVELGTAPKAFSAAYYADRLRGYSPRLAAIAGATLRRVGLADGLVAPDLRDRMFVLAAAAR